MRNRDLNHDPAGTRRRSIGAWLAPPLAACWLLLAADDESVEALLYAAEEAFEADKLIYPAAESALTISTRRAGFWALASCRVR